MEMVWLWMNQIMQPVFFNAQEKKLRLMNVKHIVTGIIKLLFAIIKMIFSFFVKIEIILKKYIKFYLIFKEFYGQKYFL